MHDTHHPTAEQLALLSAKKLRLREEWLQGEHKKALDATIAAGMGSMRQSEIRELAKGSSLLSKVVIARHYITIQELRQAVFDEFEARKRYHGGDKPIKRKA